VPVHRTPTFGMTELSFAKSFLTTLDSRPTKISAGHVEDPKTYPPRPAFILPRMPHPLPKRQKLAPGQEHSLTVSLKSLRNPPLDITLSSLPPNTSILNLKEAIEDKESIPIDKVRILYKKRPVGDSKILKEIVDEEETKIELQVMVLGGVATVRKGEEEVIPSTSTAQGPNGNAVLQGEEFWGDLRGFLIQRLRNEDEAAKVFGTFKRAWESSIARP